MLGISGGNTDALMLRRQFDVAHSVVAKEQHYPSLWQTGLLWHGCYAPHVGLCGVLSSPQGPTFGSAIFENCWFF